MPVTPTLRGRCGLHAFAVEQRSALVRGMMPPSTFISVDLPAPFSPMRMCTSPLCVPIAVLVVKYTRQHKHHHDIVGNRCPTANRCRGTRSLPEIRRRSGRRRTEPTRPAYLADDQRGDKGRNFQDRHATRRNQPDQQPCGQRRQNRQRYRTPMPSNNPASMPQKVTFRPQTGRCP